MPIIGIEEALNGDILAADVIVNEVVLFETGATLTPHRIEILKALEVRTLRVENRFRRRNDWLVNAMRNIDARFSYVQDVPFMIQIESWVQDILVNLEEHGGR
ncbi:MAG: hypothetical protein ACYC9O_20180 [Candidatus Latescibacterota bacterium]